MGGRAGHHGPAVRVPGPCRCSNDAQVEDASLEGQAVPQNRQTDGHRLRRRFTLGSGPLKRTSDRLEFLARVLLVCTVLTVIPVALATATATYTQARAQGAAQVADRHRISAVLADVAPVPPREG